MLANFVVLLIFIYMKYLGKKGQVASTTRHNRRHDHTIWRAASTCLHRYISEQCVSAQVTTKQYVCEQWLTAQRTMFPSVEEFKY
jgi:hypothetical protein